MKLALNLTFEDGMKVVEAMKNVAVENGWDAEELDECGVIEEYSRVIDAALAAMGVDISIDGNPSYEDEDEDEDFNEEDFDFDFDEEDDDEEDDDEDNVVYSLTVKGEFVLRYMEAGYPFEEACEVADILFGKGE
jgi:hypothetical protein